MLKNKALTLTTAALGLGVLTAMPARAQENVPIMQSTYISGSIGYAFMNDTEYTGGIGSDFDDDLNWSAAIGSAVNQNVRSEVELSYLTTDVDSANSSGELDIWTFMLNGYYDFEMMRQPWQPYIMGGIGAAYHDASIDQLNVSVADDDDYSFAWQLGAGVNYNFAQQTQAFGGYRYRNTTDADVNSGDVETEIHEVLVGLRYYF